MENDCSPHLWQLKFNPAMINDSGTYLCHISTDPPLIRYIHLEISGNILFIFKLLALPQPTAPLAALIPPPQVHSESQAEYCVIDYFTATSFIILHSGGWIHLHQKWKWKFNGKGFRHQYSWVIFSCDWDREPGIKSEESFVTVSVTHLSTGIWSLNGRRVGGGNHTS